MLQVFLVLSACYRGTPIQTLLLLFFAIYILLHTMFKFILKMAGVSAETCL